MKLDDLIEHMKRIYHDTVPSEIATADDFLEGFGHSIAIASMDAVRPMNSTFSDPKDALKSEGYNLAMWEIDHRRAAFLGEVTE